MDFPSRLEEAFPEVKAALDRIYITNQVWRPLPAALKLSKYEVSELGDLRRISIGNCLMEIGRNSGGYIVNRLTSDDGNTKTWSRHVLVARAFIPNPENKPMVDHINTVKTNNRVENLRWATAKENSANTLHRCNSDKLKQPISQHNPDGTLVAEYEGMEDAATFSGIPKINRQGIRNACASQELYYGFIWKRMLRPGDIELPGEIWRDLAINEMTISVSSMGRIRKQSGEASYGYEQCAYMGTHITGSEELVHRLVCRAFLGPPPAENIDYTVDHLNQNKTDNRLENLRWATRSEQRLNQTRGPINLRTRPVILISLETGEETRYESIKAAAMAISPSSDEKVTIVIRSRISTLCNARARGEKYSYYKGFDGRFDDCDNPIRTHDVILGDADL